MKHFLWSILLLALLVSACSSQSTQPVVEASPTPQAAPTQTSAETATEPPALPTAPAPGLVAAVPGCTVASPIPTPGPTIVALFPPATEADWYRGPLTAAVTVMEYSDFQ